MKKILLVLGISIAAISTATAQVPGEGEAKFSLEAQIGANFGGGSNLFSAPTVRMRYFFKDNMAIRLGVGAESWSHTDDVWSGPDNTGEMGTMKTSSNNFMIIPGFEYHIGKFDHFSPYVGAQISIGWGGDNERYENVDMQGDYLADFTYESTSPTFTLHSMVLAGFDWFFVPNIYLGGEFGVGWISKKNKPGETTVTTGGTTTTSLSPASKTSVYGNEAVGGIRLGWRF